MKSPFADCDAVLKQEEDVLEYRGEKYSYTYLFYECPITGEKFTTEETDSISMSQVHNQYRVAHCIPFPDELRKVRKANNLSARAMSAILGFGENQYRLYENGDMPNVSNGRVLYAIVNNPQSLLTYLEGAKWQMSTAEYERLKKQITSKTSETTVATEQVYGQELVRSLLNGFAAFDTDVLKNTMLYILEKVGNTFVTKMNKLLFYTDFLSYKRFGVGITGLSYKAAKYGPVPNNYNKVFSAFDEIREEEGENGTNILVALIPCDISIFSDEQKKVIDDITLSFKHINCREISEISHKEDAWQKNQTTQSFIDYTYAFSLKAV